jgi:nucleoside-diphosphate kinase
MEKTLLLIKPDAVERQIAGKILDVIENCEGLSITKLKLMKLTIEKAKEHYKEHNGKSFFDGLIEFITSGNLYALELTGDNAIAITREICGATDPKQAKAWTIRAQFADSKERNVVHSSDSVESANRELAIFFPEK